MQVYNLQLIRIFHQILMIFYLLYLQMIVTMTNETELEWGQNLKVMDYQQRQ